MIPVCIRCFRLIACALAAWQPYAALAQDEDTQLWVNLAATGELASSTTFTLDSSTRFREQRRGNEQQVVRLTVLREIAKGVKIGGGGGVFETQGGGTELRPHQEIDLRLGRFHARSRVEERFFDGADRMEVRLRQLVRYTHPLGLHWRVSIDGEYLHLAQTRMRGSDAPRNEWRAHAILSTDMSADLTLGAGYLLIHTPREHAADRLSHVPQAYLTWHF